MYVMVKLLAFEAKYLEHCAGHCKIEILLDWNICDPSKSVRISEMGVPSVLVGTEKVPRRWSAT